MILLTGGTGFVGGHVARALRGRDVRVRALVRDRRRGADLETLGCELYVGDMTRADSLRGAVDGCDCVVHLVAIRQGRPEEFERVMVQGTRTLLDAAAAAGVRRFVHMSALGTEAHRDLVPYFHAKWEQERMVEAAPFEHVIFRPSFIFGPAGGILAFFKRLARLAPVTPVAGPGTQRIQPIWADDLAAFFADAVGHEAAAGHTFELGGPDAVSWNEFWDRLKRAMGLRRPSVHVPMPLMRVNALVSERLPGEVPLTRDLLKMLEHVDNTCDVRPAVETFGIGLLPLDEQLRRAA